MGILEYEALKVQNLNSKIICSKAFDILTSFSDSARSTPLIYLFMFTCSSLTKYCTYIFARLDAILGIYMLFPSSDYIHVPRT